MSEHVSPTGGRRLNAGKLPMHLVPTSLVRNVAAVLGKGAEKYAPRNWEKGMELSIPYACAMRHLLAWMDGEDNDPESGLPHLAHVATNAAFILEYQQQIAAGSLPTSRDDRPNPPTADVARLVRPFAVGDSVICTDATDAPPLRVGAASTIEAVFPDDTISLHGVSPGRWMSFRFRLVPPA
jgi:hypothetical protein